MSETGSPQLTLTKAQRGGRREMISSGIPREIRVRGQKIENLEQRRVENVNVAENWGKGVRGRQEGKTPLGGGD